jgi:hypothetical protein
MKMMIFREYCFQTLTPLSLGNNVLDVPTCHADGIFSRDFLCDFISAEEVYSYKNEPFSSLKIMVFKSIPLKPNATLTLERTC